MTDRHGRNDVNTPGYSTVAVLTPAQLEQLVEDVVLRTLEARGEPIPANEELLSKARMAERLDVCPKTLERMRDQGCPVILVGQSPRFNPVAVIEWLRAQQTKAAAE